MIAQSVIKNSLMLAMFALISTALVAITDHFTRDKIQSEKAIALEKILHQIVPEQLHDNDLYHDCIEVKNLQLLGTDKPVKVFRARMGKQPKALLIQSVAADGYTGAIELVVGVNIDEIVTGVRVLSHRETPGLGDKIDRKKSPWMDGFVNRSLNDPKKERWKVKKDGGEFDAFTGATITPRAVVKAVSKTLQFVQQNKQELFQRESTCFVKPQDNNHE